MSKSFTAAPDGAPPTDPATPEAKKEKKTLFSPELSAMNKIERIVMALPIDARDRVADWLFHKLKSQKFMSVGNCFSQQGQSPDRLTP